MPCIVPLCLGVESDQALRTNLIAYSEQLRDIHIQWAIRLRACEQLMYRGHGRSNRERGRPGGLQSVEADLPSLEVDVWVTDGCDKADGGR